MPEKKVHFKTETKPGSAGNILVIVNFNPDASNFNKNDFTWCPTLDELDYLNKLRKLVMENEENITDKKQ